MIIVIVIDIIIIIIIIIIIGFKFLNHFIYKSIIRVSLGSAFFKFHYHRFFFFF